MMPKRTDLQSILILGSGPIVIGQAAEPALREEGYGERVSQRRGAGDLSGLRGSRLILPTSCAKV